MFIDLATQLFFSYGSTEVDFLWLIREAPRISVEVGLLMPVTGVEEAAAF